MKYYLFHTKRSRGFTLLELIVVITIIGILGTLVVVRVSGLIGKSYDAKIKTDLRAIVRTAEYYYSLKGIYPDNLDQLRTGTTADGENLGIGLDETKDPWGNDYIYELRDGKPHAYCFGRDGVEGGDNENADYQYPEASTSPY